MKLFLLSLLLFLNIALLGQNEITYYAPLFGKVKVDTTEWSLPREEPFAIYYFMKPLDYGLNYGKVIHKSTGLRVFFQNEYSYEFINGEMSFVSQDRSRRSCDLSFHPDFLTYKYGRGDQIELVSKINKGVFFVISTDAGLQDTLKLYALKELMSSFSFVEPSEIDSVMGYPLTKENLGQNFRNRLINEFVGKEIVRPLADDYSNLTANPLDTLWFDEHYFLEKKFDFSFQKLYDLRLHDINRDFSKDDYLNIIFGEDHGSPYAIYKNNTVFGKLKRNEDLEVMKCFAQDYSKAAGLQTVYFKNSVKNDGVILLYNDSAWNILYAEKELNEKGALIWKTYDHLGKRRYVTKNSEKGKVYNSTFRDVVTFGKPIDSKQFIAIANYGNECDQSDVIYETFPSVCVMNNAFRKQELTAFSTPSNIANYKVIMMTDTRERRLFMDMGIQFFWHKHAFWGDYNSESYGNFTTKLVITSNLTSKDDIDANQMDEIIASYPLNQRLVVSPVIESDLDEDGNREVYRVFISNGEIIHYEIYEQSKTGLFKMELSESIKGKIRKHDFIARLMGVSKDLNFYLFNERERYNISAGSIGDGPNRDSSEILQVVDEIPVYPGGELALMTDIKNNLIYPEMERRANIQGTVFINFVVELDGSISHIKVIKEVNGAPGLTREAKRVVMKLKIFEQPAKKDGKPVRYSYNIPVKFVLK